jgi:hypothetical protein
MTTLDVREYLDEDGTSPFADWFTGLDAVVAAKITVVLARIDQGNLSNVKGVGQGVLEYRLDFGPGYRAGTAMCWSSCWPAAPRSDSSATLRPRRRAGRTTSGERDWRGEPWH